MPQRIARILEAPVVSIYLMDEAREALVMRGNTGLAPLAVGRVELRVGEGLTGLAVKERRIVAFECAPQHDAWCAVPDLDDGQFPEFVAGPLFDEGEPVGVLVAQRASRAFSEAELSVFASICGLVPVEERGGSCSPGALRWTVGRSARWQRCGVRRDAG